MIKIVKPEDLQGIRDKGIYPYIRDLLFHILKEYENYCPDSSIEEIGAIFLLENESDFMNYSAMGLSAPITESRCEWVETVEENYLNACVVIDNEKAINIICRRDYFGEVFA